MGIVILQTLFNKLFSLASLWLLLSMIMPSQAQALSPVTISYTIKFESNKFGNATLGRIENILKTTEQGYSMESVTKAQGMAAIIMGSNEQQSCEFEVLDGKAVSQKYDGGRIGEIEYQVDFDWQQRKAYFNQKSGSSESIDLPEGYIVDNCSMWFAVALLKNDIPEHQSLYVVDGKNKRIRGFKLRSTSNETLSTKLGEKQVTKVVFERELRPGRTLTFWLSHDDEYLPLKMQESRKSRTTTFEVAELSLDS
ncbi:MAG: hypothetical protein ACI854_001022 [Arenicella sp.]|jgi:hypothetical protein